MPIELQLWSGLPSEPSAIGAHPDPCQDHGDDPGGLKDNVWGLGNTSRSRWNTWATAKTGVNPVVSCSTSSMAELLDNCDLARSNTDVRIGYQEKWECFLFERGRSVRPYCSFSVFLALLRSGNCRTSGSGPSQQGQKGLSAPAAAFHLTSSTLLQLSSLFETHDFENAMRERALEWTINLHGLLINNVHRNGTFSRIFSKILFVFACAVVSLTFNSSASKLPTLPVPVRNL